MSAPLKVRRVVQRLCYRRYATAKVYYELELRLTSRRRSGRPILVYQMGKVGSRTIVKSLRGAGLDSPIFHVHFLAEENLREWEERHRARWTRSGGAQHLWRSRYVLRLMDGPAPGQWDVITLVRDPVAQSVSRFFQLAAYPFGRAQLGLPDENGSDPETVGADLAERYSRWSEGHDFPAAWLDEELKSVLGLDLYALPFDRARGYAIYENERARLLVLKLETLRACAAAAFRDFLALDGFALVEGNVTETKSDASLYRHFTRSLELSPDFLDKMYGTRFARHFYSEQELGAFRRRWLDERP